MKKSFIFLLILSSLNSYSYTRLSSDRNFFGIFTSSKTKEITNNSYDFENDLAVVSDRILNLDEAKNDAIEGLKISIRDAAFDNLKKLLSEINLSGKDLDYDTMEKMSKDLSEEIVKTDYVVFSRIAKLSNDKYLVVAKISKKNVEKASKEIFRKRLYNVVLRLHDKYKELGE